MSHEPRQNAGYAQCNLSYYPICGGYSLMPNYYCLYYMKNTLWGVFFVLISVGLVWVLCRIIVTVYLHLGGWSRLSLLSVCGAGMLHAILIDNGSV